MMTLPDFRPVAPVPAETIERYRGHVPDELIEIWTGQGYGTAKNGYIKVIDPDLYLEGLGDCLPHPDMIPIFATGMGDVIVWNGQGVLNIEYRYGQVRGLGTRLSGFATFVSHDAFLDDLFHWQPYPAAVERYGALKYTECFYYVPLLALGGREDVDHLDKGDLVTNVNLTVQLAGPIEF